MSFDITWLQQRGYTLDGDRAIQVPRTLGDMLEMPEAALLGQIRALAQTAGWIVYHTHRSDNSEAGFPDLVLAKAGPSGKPGQPHLRRMQTAYRQAHHAPAQWLDLLRHTLPDLEVYEWRPADWPDIERILCVWNSQRSSP